MGKTKATTATTSKKSSSPLKISTSLFQKRKTKLQSTSESSSEDSSSVPSPSVTKKKTSKATPKAKIKSKAPAKTKDGTQKGKGESKKKVGAKKQPGKKIEADKGTKGTKVTKKVAAAKTKKDKAPIPKSKRNVRARSPSSSNSDTSSSSDDTSSSNPSSPSPPPRRAASTSNAKKSPVLKKVLTKKAAGNVPDKKGSKSATKEKGTGKKAGTAKVTLGKKGSPVKSKAKPTKPKAKLKRMASLNAKAMLEATFSFESGEKRKSPAPSKSPTKVDHPTNMVTPGSESSGNAPDFKPLTLLFSSIGDADFPSTKEPKSGGERKRKSTSKGSESPVRRESSTNGTFNQGDSKRSDTTDILLGSSGLLKSEKEKSKSPAPRKKSKVMSSSVSTSTSPFDSGEETKSVLPIQDQFGYDQHPGIIRDLHQRNFSLTSSFHHHQEPSSQTVHSDDHPNHFHLQHHHQGSLVKGRGSTLSSDKSKPTTPNATIPFGSTVYQPAGPLIEPHKISSVPAGLLPDSVRIPSDLKVTYQPRPPPSSICGNQTSRNSNSSENKKSEVRTSNSTASAFSTSTPHRSQSKNILHQPYKSATTTSSSSMTVTSSTKQQTSNQSSNFIHSPLPVNSPGFVGNQGGGSLSMGAGATGGPLGGAIGTMTQSAALSSHINPSSAIMTAGAAGATPGSLYFGYGHQSPFAPSKFPIVPPDTFRTQSPFGSPYMYPQTTPPTPPNYFMSPSFYGSQGVGTPSGGSGLQTRPLFNPFYQSQPPPSAHPVSNYYVTAPPVPPPSHHSMQPSTAPGHAGPSHPNPSSQPACPCPMDSSPRNNNSISSSSNSINNNTSNKVNNRSLLRKQPLPATNATLQEDSVLAVVKNKATASKLAKTITQHGPIRDSSLETKPKSAVRSKSIMTSNVANVRLNKKLLKLNTNSNTTINLIPTPPATQLENAKTFTEQYSLPDDITITPIIMSTSQSQDYSMTYSTPLPKPEKKKDIVHVIDPRSGEATTIAKHISINNIHRNNLNLPNVSSVKPNNAGNVGKISPSLDVIVLNSKQSNAKGKSQGAPPSRPGLLISPGHNSERPQPKSQQSNLIGKSLVINNSNTNLVQPLYQNIPLNTKSENKNKAVRRKGLSLHECIDGLQRKKMRILADTNVSITNVTPGSTPPSSAPGNTDHHRVLSISITPDTHDQPEVFNNNPFNNYRPTLKSKKETKPKAKNVKSLAIHPSKRQQNSEEKNFKDDFGTKVLDSNDAVAAVSALLIPPPRPIEPPLYGGQNPPASGMKKRPAEKKPALKIKLFKSETGSIITRSSSQTPKLRSRGNKSGETPITTTKPGTAGGKRSRLLLRKKDSDSSGSLTPSSLPYCDLPNRNGSSTMTTSNNHVILRIPKASERQGRNNCGGTPSGNMTLNAMKKRAIVKPLSPALINGAIQTLAMINKKLPVHTHPRWSNGWRFEGKPFEAKVYVKNDDNPVLRRCYPTMRHDAGDVIKARDCVLLKSGPRKLDLPFVAKVAALFENPTDGEMMFSLLWYYRPEHTDIGRNKEDMIDEIFASKHRDSNSVATIEDKCYVFTFNQYCRYKKRLKQLVEGITERTPIVPLAKHPTDSRVPMSNFATEIANAVWNGISRTMSNLSVDNTNAPSTGNVHSLLTNSLLMPIPPVSKSNHTRSGIKHQQSSGKISPEVVFFCRRVYDYRQKRMLKNPS